MTSGILPTGVGLVAVLLIVALSAIPSLRVDTPQLSDAPPMPDSDLAIIMEPSGCYLCDVSGMLLGALICSGIPLLPIALILGILRLV